MAAAVAPLRMSGSSENSFVPISRRSTGSAAGNGTRSARQSKRVSVTAYYLSMSASKERELDIEDDLAKAQKVLRELKGKISAQSKRNFVLEKDVRYLDSRIALLIQNRLRIEEQNEFANHLEEPVDLQQGYFPNDDKTQKYGNLFFLLQSQPRYIAHLCRLITMSEIDSLLQTVMFTIYGNQYESREEHLLLTMFQVRMRPHVPCDEAFALIDYHKVCTHSSIRYHSRLLLSFAAKHTCVSHDDDLHPTRPWPKLP